MSKIPTVQKHYRVCDVHFDEQSKFPFNRNRTNLKVGSIPCLHLPAPKKIAAWLLKRQLPSNPDDRGTTRKTITLCITLENWIDKNGEKNVSKFAGIYFSKMCLVSCNGKKQVKTDVHAENGSITIFGALIPLRNRVKCLKNDEKNLKSVLIESNSDHIFDKIEIIFPNRQEKIKFLIALGDLFEASPPPSPASDQNNDSGL
jgi:hypothetical protein